MHIGAYTGIHRTLYHIYGSIQRYQPQISTVLWLHRVGLRKLFFDMYTSYIFTLNSILYILGDSKTNEECLFILAY